MDSSEIEASLVSLSEIKASLVYRATTSVLGTESRSSARRAVALDS